MTLEPLSAKIRSIERMLDGNITIAERYDLTHTYGQLCDEQRQRMRTALQTPQALYARVREQCGMMDADDVRTDLMKALSRIECGVRIMREQRSDHDRIEYEVCLAHIVLQAYAIAAMRGIFLDDEIARETPLAWGVFMRSLPT